jgi:two-component system, LuxR family, sensor kinase FixL
LHEFINRLDTELAVCAAPRCVNCQSEAFAEARYCAYCGARLTSDSPVSPDQNAETSDSAELSAQLLRKLVNVLNDAIHVVDPATSRFLEVNQQACDRLGYTREEMLTLGVMDIEALFPDEASWAQQAEHLRKSGSMLLEGVHRRKDGATFPTEVSIAYVKLYETEYLIAVCRDITERKRSEQRLRDSEERFRLITETIQEVFYIAATDFRRTDYVSPAYERIWGRSCEELLANPRSFLDAVHPDDRERVLDFFDKRSAGESYAQEYRIVRPDGSVRWILDQGFPTNRFAPSAAGFVGSAGDITERKLGEIKLRESEERYRTLFETCGDAVFILDLTGRILAANPAAQEMHGYTLEELLTMSIRNLTVPADAKSSPSRLKRVKNGESLRFQVFHQRKDGTTFPEDVIATPLRMGGETFVLSFERDMTEQVRSWEREKILRDELSHAARLGTMGEMATGLAHELNQPLAALILYAETARRLGTKSKELQEVLQAIEEQAFRAGEIIRRMRKFVKRVPPTRAKADLNQLIQEVLRLLEHDLRNNGVRLILELDERLPAVLAETIQIQQIVVNLVRNAVDAMADIPRSVRTLTIRTEEIEGGIKVSVIDTGCGIEPAVLAHLFEPFQTTKSNGMGIGLSICQTLIQAHDGSIGTEPNPPGGTIFYFVLPVVEEPVVS